MRKIALLLIFVLCFSLMPIKTIISQEESTKAFWVGENVTMESISWRPDNSYGLLVNQNGKVLKYDGSNFEVLNTSIGFTPIDIAWKPDSSYAVIVGSQGHVALYNGNLFSSLLEPTSSNLNEVSWKPDGAYALIAGNGGALLRFDGLVFASIATYTIANLQSVAWNSLGSKALITGDSGTLLEYDHTDGRVYWFGENTRLESVSWNPSNTLGLIVGYEGICLGYDGTRFSVLNDTLGFHASAVDWKRDGSEATLVGSGGHITKYSGGTFTSVFSPTTNDLLAVSWRIDGSYALIAGISGTLLAFNGLSVGVIQSKTNSNLCEIGWDSNSEKALVVGDAGVALIFDATKPFGKQVFWLGQNINLLSVAWRPGDSYGLLAGYEGIVLRYDGSRFTRLITGLATPLNDVAWKPDGSYAVLVGNGGIAVKYDGTLFSSLTTGTTNDLVKIRWQPSGSIALIVGNGGTILKYNGNMFTPVMSTSVGFVDNLKSVSWALNGSYAVIIGENGVALEYKTSESKVYWLGRNLNLDTAAWRPDRSYCLIVGEAGIVMKYDGASFEPLATGLATYLYDVQWNHGGTKALIVGSEGIAALYDGVTFTSLTPPTTNNLYKIGWSPDDSYALITGAQGLVLEYKNGIFRVLNSGTTSDLNSVSWNATHAVLVGNSGVAISWNGTEFRSLNTETSYNLWDVDWKPDGSYAFIVSQYGEILKFDGRTFTKLSTGDWSDFYYYRCSLQWKPDGSYVLISGYRYYSPYNCLWRYDGVTTTRLSLRAVTWGIEWNPNNDYAIVLGGAGEVAKYVDDTLSYLSASTSLALWDVGWKPGSSYALIVSQNGELLKFDGSIFTYISTGDGNDFYYYPCSLAWKPDGSYVLISGYRYYSSYGCLWRYDEITFTRIDLRAIPYGLAWRYDSSYAIIVGDQGQIAKFDGSSLLYISASTSYSLWDVDWKPDGSYALIVSQYGGVLKFFSSMILYDSTGDGNDFTSYRCRLDWNPFGTYALIVGSTYYSPYYCLWRYDGATFAKFALMSNPRDIEWRADGLFSLIVGDAGQVVRYDGFSLLYHSASTSYSLWDVDWKPDGSYALIISQWGSVLKYDGWMFTYDQTNGNDFSYGRCGVDWHDSGIWCVITGYSYSSPYYFLWRYDGATFVQVPLNQLALDVAFQPGGDFCIAVGSSGAAWMYDSINVLPLNTGVTSDLFGIAWRPDGAYALIVGSSGTVLKFDGLFFTKLTSGVTQPLKAVSWSRDGSYAIIVGASGTVLKYDGTDFTTLSSGVLEELIAVDFGETSALIAGRTGRLLKYEDDVFSTVQLDTTADLQGVAFTPSGNYAIVTSAGGSAWKVYVGSPEPPLTVTVDSNPAIVMSGNLSKVVVNIRQGTTPITDATIQLRSSPLEATFSTISDLGNGTYISYYTAPSVVHVTMDRIIALATKQSFTPGLGYADILVQPQQDLFISEIELIQVTNNQKALIADKKTVACVHVESSLNSRIWAEIKLEYNFSSSVYVETGPFGDGVPIDPGSNRIYVPGGPAFPAASTPWIVGSQPPWLIWDSTGIDSSITVTIDPFNKVAEADETNNVKQAQMKIAQADDLRILCVPVHFPDIGQQSLNPQMNNEVSFIRDTYPVAEDKIVWTQSQSFPWPGSPPVPTDPANQTQQARLRDWLYWRVAVPISVMAVLMGHDRAVIVVHDMGQNWGGIAIGMLRYPENRVPVFITEGAGDGVVAHEIGHTFYLWHPHDIGPQVYDATRFWVAQRDYEDIVNTFMSYRSPPLWIDQGRYDSDPKQWMQITPFIGTWQWNLFEQLKQGVDPEIIVIKGDVLKNGSIIADEPWYRLPYGTPDLNLGTTGNYTVTLLSSEHLILGEIGFNASFTFIADVNGTLVEAETDLMPFAFSIPYISGAASIEIRNRSGYTLISRGISSHAPNVTLTFPNEGSILSIGTNYNITWEASDLDYDTLTYSVAYSLDEGANWIPLALDLHGNSYIWNTSQLESRSSYLVRVIANDGINTGEDISDANIKVTIQGDVNGDFLVNAADMYTLGKAFGSTPSSPDWNSNADINNDLIINSIDLGLLRKNYGKAAGP